MVEDVDVVGLWFLLFINLLAGTLDFEGTQFYELTLTVSDSTFSTVAEVTVTVTAVNEGGPSFTSSTFSASVTEGASLGHTVRA